jgi:urease accessory protein
MKQASLELNFSCRDDRTVLNVLRQEPPWRALRAFPNESGEALVHLHNVSGGILGGDGLRLEADLKPGARAQITAVGATRIYRRRAENSAAYQATKVTVGDDAFLEYLPDPVIPFADSCFEQKSEIHLENGAGLIWWETLSAGRIAKGETFAFENVCAEIAIYARGAPIAREHYSLTPKLREMSSPARFGRFLYSTTMYVCRVGEPSGQWIALERELNDIGRLLLPGSAKWGASALVGEGVVVRGMAQSAHEIGEGLNVMWRTAKQKIWGRRALLPRKIY